MSAPSVPFDPMVLRQRFPLFAQPDNAQLIYLDNAATTQKPDVVIDAVMHFYLHANANAHRASHRLARAATAMLEEVRDKVARYIGAGTADEIVFCRGATEGLNLLAFALTQSLQAGDEIILSVAEHHANLVPWQMAAQRHGLVLKFIPLGATGLDLDRLPHLLTSRTRIVALTAASNALGFAVDVAMVATVLAARQDIVLVVDAAQAMAHATVDVRHWQCDFLVCSAHKFYGPTGIGFVYGRQQRWRELPPWQGGGEMIESVTLEHTRYAAPPHRFEAGTSALADIAGLGAAIDFLAVLPRVAVQAHEQQLMQQLHTQLQAVEWIEVISVASGNVGIAAFRPKPVTGLSCTDIAAWLDEHDIAVRSGTHCAQPLVQQLGGPWLRASVAAYNTAHDIDRLLACIRDMPLPIPLASGVAAGPVTAGVVQGVGVDDFGFDDLSGLSLSALREARSWQARFGLLLQWGERIAPKPRLHDDSHRVSGCETLVWLAHRQVRDRHRFAIDAESRVIRGLAALLLVLIDDRTADDIKALDLAAVFTELGLVRHLSPSRVNGFQSLVRQALSQASVAPGLGS